MNTKLIQSTSVKHLPKFPALTPVNKNRIVTKHYTNLSLWLPTDQLSLLTWLIYETKVDNTFTYTTDLLERYSTAIKAAKKAYCIKRNKLDTQLISIRATLKALIECGLIFAAGYKTYIINPCLTFRSEYMRPKEYEEITDLYQSQDIAKVAKKYIEIVNGYLKKK